MSPCAARGSPSTRCTWCRKVEIRLPGKGNSNSLGARPVHQIISMIKWIRTIRLSIKNSLSPPVRSAWITEYTMYLVHLGFRVYGLAFRVYGLGLRGLVTCSSRFRGGLVFNFHRLLYHSTLGLRVIKRERVTCSSSWRRTSSSTSRS